MLKVVFTTRFDSIFKKLEKQFQQQLLNEISILAQDPFRHPNIRKIVGVKQNAFRLRVGRWRVVYIVITQKNVIEVIDLFIKKGRDDYRI